MHLAVSTTHKQTTQIRVHSCHCNGTIVAQAAAKSGMWQELIVQLLLMLFYSTVPVAAAIIASTATAQLSHNLCRQLLQRTHTYTETHVFINVALIKCMKWRHFVSSNVPYKGIYTVIRYRQRTIHFHSHFHLFLFF